MQIVYIIFLIMTFVVIVTYLYLNKKENYLADYYKLKYCAERPTKTHTPWYY